MGVVAHGVDYNKDCRSSKGGTRNPGERLSYVEKYKEKTDKRGHKAKITKINIRGIINKRT